MTQEFVWGAATAAYQIEGAAHEDGRKPSIWDTYSRTPGRVLNGDTGDVATDHYHRWPEDVETMTALGLRAYRFSIAWPRIHDQRGIDFYSRLVDALLERGIAPVATLYHWDLPSVLEREGGWPSRSTAEAFADYTSVVAERLGDRVDRWATLNEPWCSAFLGYAAGVHAPGRREPEAAYAAAHHLLLGHALGRAAVRTTTAGAQVAIVLNLTVVHPETPADEAAAEFVDTVQNGIWLEPLAAGRYPKALSAVPALTGDGVVQDGDLARIEGSVDWLGINYYTPFRIGTDPDATLAVGQASDAYPYAPSFVFRPRAPRTDMGWEIDPGGLTETLRMAAAALPGVPLRVTENGAAFPDAQQAGDGTVQDDDRIDYLQQHLAAVDDARAEGAPVVDYFAWSLLDNFEWAEGYLKTFGLVQVDSQTQDRRPKASFRWYTDRIRG
jgi:beta-glucosidase